MHAHFEMRTVKKIKRHYISIISKLCGPLFIGFLIIYAPESHSEEIKIEQFSMSKDSFLEEYATLDSYLPRLPFCKAGDVWVVAVKGVGGIPQEAFARLFIKKDELIISLPTIRSLESQVVIDDEKKVISYLKFISGLPTRYLFSDAKLYFMDNTFIDQAIKASKISTDDLNSIKINFDKDQANVFRYVVNDSGDLLKTHESIAKNGKYAIPLIEKVASGMIIPKLE